MLRASNRRKHRSFKPRFENLEDRRVLSGVAEEFVVFDFEDAVLHDTQWLSSQPAGTVAPVVRPKADSGNNNLSLAPGEGVNGSTALLVESTDSSMGLPSFWVAKYQSTGDSFDNIYDDRGYMLPRGMQANRLEFSFRFEDGFRANSAAHSARVDNFHFGTFNFDPTKSGRVVESDNWHFYHQIFVRHNQAGDEWIKVVLNSNPAHQRSLSALPPVNPTQPAGDYWELLTRFYLEATPYFSDPESSYPVKMWVDDIKLSYVPEPHEIELQIENFLNGQEVKVAKGSDYDFQATIRNTTDAAVSGVLSATTPYWLNPSILDAATGQATPSSVALAPGETRNVVLRIRPDTDLSLGNSYYAGLMFVPDDQFTTNNAGLNDPNVEQRRWPDAGPIDAITYGAHVRTIIGTPEANLRPVAQGGVILNTGVNQALQGQLIAVDPEGDTLTYSLVSQDATGGQLSLDASTGQFIFTPDAGFTEVYRFVYEVHDGIRSSNEAVVWINARDDFTPPTADLADPQQGADIVVSVLNGRRYLDVTFADTGGSGLDLSSITDAGAEFTLSGAAASGVNVNGAAVLVSGTTYQYSFTGSFGEGSVTANFAADAWRDNAGNINTAESESFTTTSPLDSTPPTAQSADPTNGGNISVSVLNGRQYLDVTYADTGGSGLDLSSITDAGAEFTLSGAAASGVTVNGAAVLVSGTTYRYSFTGGFGVGPVTVNFTAGAWQDNAGNANTAETESFNVTNESVGIIIDNRDPELTLVGNWGTASNFPGYYGDDYLHDGNNQKGNKTATFTPHLPNSGTYEVYLQWAGHALYSDNVPVDITHADGVTSVFVNQQVNGGQFNLLGTFNFSAGTLGNVTIRTEGTTQYVMADAVRFVPENDAESPTADLSDPSHGGSIVSSVLNGRQYVDVTFADAGGSGLDLSSITDAGGEFTLSGAAASGVTVNGAAVLVSGTTYRYSFTGGFGVGPVTVNFAAGAWQDNASNTNAAESESFTTTPPPDTTAPSADLADPSQGENISVSVLNGRQFVDVTFADAGGSGLDLSSITDAGGEFTLSGAAASGVTVNGAAVLVSGNTYRYSFTGGFGEGTTTVNFTAGAWQDNAGNANAADTESFNVTNASVDITIDNRDPELTLVGDWGTASDFSGYYGDDYLHDGNNQKGNKTATFTPHLPISGTYEVYLQWAGHALYSDNVPVDITHADGVTSVFVNQQVNGGQFNLLGTFSFSAGTLGKVTIRTEGTTQYVMADAVRFVHVDDVASPTADLAGVLHAE